MRAGIGSQWSRVNSPQCCCSGRYGSSHSLICLWCSFLCFCYSSRSSGFNTHAVWKGLKPPCSWQPFLFTGLDQGCPSILCLVQLCAAESAYNSQQETWIWRHLDNLWLFCLLFFSFLFESRTHSAADLHLVCSMSLVDDLWCSILLVWGCDAFHVPCMLYWCGHVCVCVCVCVGGVWWWWLWCGCVCERERESDCLLVCLI